MVHFFNLHRLIEIIIYSGSEDLIFLPKAWFSQWYQDWKNSEYAGNIQLTQSGPDELLHFDGSLDWLTDGEELELAVVDAECDSIPEDINRLGTKHAQTIKIYISD